MDHLKEHMAAEFLAKADELRDRAKALKGGGRETMLRIAADYDHMAAMTVHIYETEIALARIQISAETRPNSGRARSSA